MNFTRVNSFTSQDAVQGLLSIIEFVVKVADRDSVSVKYDVFSGLCDDEIASSTYNIFKRFAPLNWSH